MQPLAKHPADIYRRVDLDARIEASSSKDLTMICLEEVISSLALALLAMDRHPTTIPTQPLTRAQGIAVWLARGISKEHPLYEAMTQFYGGLAATIARNIARPSAIEIAQARDDFADLLNAAKAA